MLEDKKKSSKRGAGSQEEKEMEGLVMKRSYQAKIFSTKPPTTKGKTLQHHDKKLVDMFQSWWN